MTQFATAPGMPPLDLNETTLLKIRRRDGPGNVRDIKNLVERSVILGALPQEFAGGGAVTGPEAAENLDLVVQRHILHVLGACDGNRTEAARQLGVSRKTTNRKIAAWIW